MATVISRKTCTPQSTHDSSHLHLTLHVDCSHPSTATSSIDSPLLLFVSPSAHSSLLPLDISMQGTSKCWLHSEHDEIATHVTLTDFQKYKKHISSSRFDSPISGKMTGGRRTSTLLGNFATPTRMIIHLEEKLTSSLVLTMVT